MHGKKSGWGQTRSGALPPIVCWVSGGWWCLPTGYGDIGGSSWSGIAYLQLGIGTFATLQPLGGDLCKLEVICIAIGPYWSTSVKIGPHWSTLVQWSMCYTLINSLFFQKRMRAHHLAFARSFTVAVKHYWNFRLAQRLIRTIVHSLDAILIGHCSFSPSKLWALSTDMKSPLELKMLAF